MVYRLACGLVFVDRESSTATHIGQNNQCRPLIFRCGLLHLSAAMSRMTTMLDIADLSALFYEQTLRVMRLVSSPQPVCSLQSDVRSRISEFGAGLVTSRQFVTDI